MSMFKKAIRKASKLRIGLVGPSGSGKTMTALRIAMGLVDGGRIALLDTESGSASLYTGEEVEEGTIEFDVLELDNYAPQNFVAAIKDAEAAGYDVLIIDSLSHAWVGVLEEHDKAVARQRGGNSFTAWKDVTPLHNELVSTILRSGMHVICTMRAKTEYVMVEDSRGKQVPKKIGLAPVQRAGMEYEFTVVADIDLEKNTMIIGKTRCRALSDGVFPRAGGDVAHILREWLDNGETDLAYVERVLGEAGLSVDDFELWSVAKDRGPLADYTSGQLFSAARWLEGAGPTVIRKWIAEQESPNEPATPEAPKPVTHAPVGEGHHESWDGKEQKRFFASLKAPYADVKAFLSSLGKAKPSALSQGDRDKCLGWLNGAGAERLAAFVEASKASE